MTLEEWAIYEAAERDAQILGYFLSENYRAKGPDDPCLMIVGKDETGQYHVISAGEACQRIEAYYDSSFEGHNNRPPRRDPGIQRPRDLVV